MIVCIVGAGVSGLACALTLEKHGIKPDIYDQFERCGGRITFIVCFLQIMHRPVVNLLQELSENYGVKIKPLTGEYHNPYSRVLKHIILFSDIPRTGRAV